MVYQKKGDKLKLKNKNNISKFIYMVDIAHFLQNFFKNKFKYSKFKKLDQAIKQVSLDIKKEKKIKK